MDDFLMESRHFIKTLQKQNVKEFFFGTLIALDVKWVLRLRAPIFTEHPRWLLLRCMLPLKTE